MCCQFKKQALDCILGQRADKGRRFKFGALEQDICERTLLRRHRESGFSAPD